MLADELDGQVVLMAHDSDAKGLSFLMADQIPTADPEDLKALWNFNPAKESGLKMPPKPGTAYGVSCLPARFRGLDVPTIHYRLMWLTMFIGQIDFPNFRETKPDDAVFKAFAMVPMAGLNQHKGPLPYDLDELTRLIENESKT